MKSMQHHYTNKLLLHKIEDIENKIEDQFGSLAFKMKDSVSVVISR